MSNSNHPPYKYEILHLNIRGARSNKDNLTRYISDCNYPEVITLNETKLGTKTRFDLAGYECASRLEFSDTGGSHGSMILVRSDIKNITEIEDVRVRFPRDEIIGIEIKGEKRRPSLKVFTHYLPPKNNPKRDIVEYIGRQNGNCVFTGDLNCKNTFWGSTRTDTRGTELMQSLDTNNLVVFNNDTLLAVTGKKSDTA